MVNCSRLNRLFFILCKNVSKMIFCSVWLEYEYFNLTFSLRNFDLFLFFRDWNCDVASLKLIRMRKFKSSALEKKQERNDNETDENLKEGNIKT